MKLTGQISKDKGLGGPAGHYAPAAPRPLPDSNVEGVPMAYHRPLVQEDPPLLKDPPTSSMKLQNKQCVIESISSA